MRLKCEVQVTNRLLPTLNLSKPKRAIYAQVSVGRKPGSQNKNGQVFMMLCTAQNRNGTKYLLHNNVEQIFAKFTNEGKATVRLSNPTDDIAFSKADPKQLVLFLKLLRLASLGKEFPENSLSTLAPASAKQIEKPQTNLQISGPSEYPMTFPSSLRQLAIKNCSLRRISPHIMALKELRSLDLSFNCLSAVPDLFCQLVNIHTLHLAGNKLTTFPVILCSSDISKCLATLNLRNNEIQWVPDDIVKLKSLNSLHLSQNLIRRLPQTMAFMTMLSNIYMSDNKLEFLPGILLSRRFDIADFSNNPFSGEPLIDTKQSYSFPVPTLSELSARVIVTHRIPYSKEELDHHSIEYLKKAQFCICGKPCFEASTSRLLQRKVPAILSYEQGEVPFLISFCSRACHSRLLKS